MSLDSKSWESFSRCIFILMALIVPFLVGSAIFYQFTTPAFDFFLARDDSAAVIAEVVRGGAAEAAGVQSGDVILSVNGAPFSLHSALVLNQTNLLQVQRGAERLAIAVPTVSVARVYHPLQSGALFFVSLVLWGTGALLLLRRFRRKEVRIFFFLNQVGALAVLWPLAHPSPAPIPEWMTPLTIAGFNLTPPLFLHFYLTFPVHLGAFRQRVWALGLVYALALVAIAGGLTRTNLGVRFSIFYIVSVVILAIAVQFYVYARRATADGRRRLRLIVLGNVLALSPPVLLYLGPSILGSYNSIPTPILPVRLSVVFAPLCHLYATARHNLFDIDRLINRALVYAILSLGILSLFLGPFLLIYRFIPNEPLVQISIVAVVTLFVGLSFEWTRTRVQRLIDRVFYGGWYDYPGVVETISTALARSIERAQMKEVLTREVPSLMQLKEGHLLIGENGSVETAARGQLEFPLLFQGQPRGLWLVDARRDGEDFTTVDHRILKTIAAQAETALGNVLRVETLRQQLDEIRSSRETLAQAQHQLLRSREEERARLARDLHDGPIQDLVGLNMQLGLLLAGDNAAILESIKPMRAEVRELLGELRQVCAELRPPMLDTVGLAAALRVLADEWSTQSGVAIQLDLPSDASLRSLPSEVSVNLYRLAQEALANVARHAAARLVTLHLTWDEKRLALTLHDDGRGFTAPPRLDALSVRGHFGLAGMHERAALIGGTCAVESSLGRGTTVRVTWVAQ